MLQRMGSIYFLTGGAIFSEAGNLRGLALKSAYKKTIIRKNIRNPCMGEDG